MSTNAGVRKHKKTFPPNATRNARTFAKPSHGRNINAGRPPFAKKPQAALSADMTRNLIRTHHQLNKELVKAEAQGKEAEAEELRKRIADLGGLQSYQQASILGQSTDRGKDSSVVLMQWLKPVATAMEAQKSKPRLLEVGALSTKNACSKSGLFDIERIDLFSQAEGIVQQDFMERPIPSSNKEQFDLISLSLVLNFVPDPVGRGEMLKRTLKFLGPRAPRLTSDKLQGVNPALFLVLPAACVTNSRYMNEERLTCIMASLGYVLLERKLTAKLVYYLWQLRDKPVPEEQNFAKKEINPGAGRNNFSVILKT
jgi:25S rRNA (adenine2142-N1)-methyltransferase